MPGSCGRVRRRAAVEEQRLTGFLEVLTPEQAREKLLQVTRHAEGCAAPAEMPWIAELRELARAQEAERARAAAHAKAMQEAAAAAEEKRRQEIEELRRQGKHRTHEEIEADMRRSDEALRRQQMGVFGKFKDLVVGKPR